MFAEIFVALYLAHLAADYPLQTDWQAENKADHSKEGWRANLTHATTHVAVSTAALAAGWWLAGWPLNPPGAIAALAWIGTSHSLIDRRRAVAWWMENTGQVKYLANGGAAHVDQTAHLLALGIAAAFITGGAS